MMKKDTCISAVKEKDIEAKLKQVISDWIGQEFQFSVFKNRGELLLKFDKIQELISLMEDSLMVLGSLMTNRWAQPWTRSYLDYSHFIQHDLHISNITFYKKNCSFWKCICMHIHRYVYAYMHTHSSSKHAHMHRHTCTYAYMHMHKKELKIMIYKDISALVKYWHFLIQC